MTVIFPKRTHCEAVLHSLGIDLLFFHTYDAYFVDPISVKAKPARSECFDRYQNKPCVPIIVPRVCSSLTKVVWAFITKDSYFTCLTLKRQPRLQLVLFITT